MLRYGVGITNAAYRTTRGSSDLRKSDFAGSAERLERLARSSGPSDRLRRQGGVPRPVRRASGARPPGATARRNAALRAALDLAGERRRALGRAAALVPRAAGPRRVERSRRGVRSQLVRRRALTAGAPPGRLHECASAALLRGINIGSRKRIAMPALRDDRRVARPSRRRDVPPERQRRVHAGDRCSPADSRRSSAGDRGRDGPRRAGRHPHREGARRIVEANPYAVDDPTKVVVAFLGEAVEPATRARRPRRAICPTS